MSDIPKYEDTHPLEEQREPSSVGEFLPNPGEQVGTVEAGLRGGAQGLSLGTSEEILAGLQSAADLPQTGFNWEALKAQYDKHVADQRAREAAAAEQNPIVYHGAEIATPFLLPAVGALGTAGKLGKAGGLIAEGAELLNVPGKAIGLAGEALEALPGAAKLAKAAPATAKILKGAGEGAILGGAYGAGKTEAPITSEEGLKQIKESAEFGGLLGGGLSTLGATASELATRGSTGKGMFGDFSRAYLSGVEGKDLRNFDKIVDKVYDYGQVTGNKLLINEVQRIKNAFNNLEASGDKKASIQEIFDALKNMRENAKYASDPEAQKIIQGVTNTLQNKAYGLEQLVEKQQMTIKPGTPGKSSTIDELQAQVDSMNSDAVATARQTGEPIKKYQVVSDPESGNLNIKEITPPGAEKGESAKILNKEWQPSKEAVPEIPSSLEQEPVFMKERPGMFNEEGQIKTPELPLKDLTEMEKLFGERSFAAEGGTPEKEIYNTTDKLFTKAVDELSPEYAQARGQFKQMSRAFEDVNIDPKKAIQYDVGSPELKELVNKVAPKEMAKINGLIAQKLEGGLQGKMAEQELEVFYNRLQKAGFKDIPQIQQKLEENMKDLLLAEQISGTKISPALASHNPKVQALGALKSFGVGGVHRVGLAQNSPLTQNITKLAPATIGKSFAAQTSTPVESFSRDLSYSDNNDLSQVSNALKSDKNLSYLGNALEIAINSGDTVKKNAIIFAISQNPEARKYLGK